MYGTEFLIALTLITQVIIPLFVPNLKLFWLFRVKSKPDSDYYDEIDEINKGDKKEEEKEEKKPSITDINIG